LKLSESFDVLLLLSRPEPAIDEAAMLEEIAFQGVKSTRLAAYLTTRDPSHLAFLPGSSPTLYRVRPLRAREANEIVQALDAPKPDELWDVVRACFEGVKGENVPVFGEDSFVVIDARRKLRRLTDDAMETLADFCGLKGVRELGEAVIRRAVLASSDAAPFALPHG
jgi:hypothetical protein